jgi:hypothetical protein
VYIKGLNPNPRRVKIIPPISSWFHAMISRPIKTKDGTRCINKEPRFCQNVRSGENESKANRLTMAIARMHNILGTQCTIFTDVFIL